MTRQLGEINTDRNMPGTRRLIDLYVREPVGINCSEYPTHYTAVKHGGKLPTDLECTHSEDGQVWEPSELYTLRVPDDWIIQDNAIDHDGGVNSVDDGADLLELSRVGADNQWVITLAIDTQGHAYYYVGIPNERHPQRNIAVVHHDSLA